MCLLSGHDYDAYNESESVPGLWILKPVGRIDKLKVYERSFRLLVLSMALVVPMLLPTSYEGWMESDKRRREFVVFS
jgi:hypothetical protein